MRVALISLISRIPVIFHNSRTNIHIQYHNCYRSRFLLCFNRKTSAKINTSIHSLSAWRCNHTLFDGFFFNFIRILISMRVRSQFNEIIWFEKKIICVQHFSLGSYAVCSMYSAFDWRWAGVVACSMEYTSNNVCWFFCAVGIFSIYSPYYCYHPPSSTFFVVVVAVIWCRSFFSYIYWLFGIWRYVCGALLISMKLMAHYFEYVMEIWMWYVFGVLDDDAVASFLVSCWPSHNNSELRRCNRWSFDCK